MTWFASTAQLTTVRLALSMDMSCVMRASQVSIWLTTMSASTQPARSISAKHVNHKAHAPVTYAKLGFSSAIVAIVRVTRARTLIVSSAHSMAKLFVTCALKTSSSTSKLISVSLHHASILTTVRCAKPSQLSAWPASLATKSTPSRFSA